MAVSSDQTQRAKLDETTLLISLQYFKNSLNTRLSLVYVESWQEQDQAAGFSRQRNIQQAMKDFSDYVGRKLYTVDKDTAQLLT